MRKLRKRLAELRAKRRKQVKRRNRFRKAYRTLAGRAERSSAQIKRLRNRIMRANRPDGQLTPHFTIREFDCNDGTRVPDYMEPHLRDLCKRVLEPLREEFGPCTVTSGYRHSAYNRQIGGATMSYHVYEARQSQPAADVKFARGNPTQWARRARESLGDEGGVGTYVASGFVHVDTRNHRSDWFG